MARADKGEMLAATTFSLSRPVQQGFDDISIFFVCTDQTFF